MLGPTENPAAFRGQVTRADARRIVVLLHRRGTDYRAVIRLRAVHRGRVSGHLIVRVAPPPPVQTVVVTDPPVVQAAPPTAPTQPTVPTTPTTPTDTSGHHDDGQPEHEHEHEIGDD